MSPTIPVLARARGVAWPSDEAPPMPASYMQIGDALTVDHKTDAHTQACSAPSTPYRLRKAAAAQLPDGVSIVAFMVDVDGPDHAANDEWWQTEQIKIARLLEKHPGAFVYRTRGGYRVVYLLPDPRVIRSDDDAASWSLSYHRSLLYLARIFGIIGDPACADWTRLYRLPHATRDPKHGPEQLETIGDPRAIGAWHCTTDLAADKRTARELHETFLRTHPDAKSSPWGAVLRRLDPPPVSTEPATGERYTGSGMSPRARAALDAICSDLANLPAGSRNPACNVAAVKLGHFVNVGELSEHDAAECLFEAMAVNGSVKDYGTDAVRGTIRSGLAAGKKDPPKVALRVNGKAPNPAAQLPEIDPDLAAHLDGGEPEEPGAPAQADPGLTAECSDLANAERLERDHGHDLLHCSALGGWYAWDGARFERDTTKAAERMATDVARVRLAEAAALVRDAAEALARAKADDDKDDIAKAKAAADHANKLYAWAAQSQSVYRIAAMLTVASAARSIAVSSDGFDRDPWLLNCSNGTVDLRTSKLRKHDRSDRVTKVAGAAFDPTATAPTWIGFLADILPDPDVRGFVQRLMGYSLTGVIREHILPVFYGGGSNGKGTLLETWQAMLGEYAKTIPAEMLMVRNGDAHPTERASLLGVRFAAAQESEQGKTLAEGLIKSLTGGDRIAARFMHHDFFDFAPTHKLVLATNHRPRVKGTDHGIWRRIALVPFTVTIADDRQDRALPEKLRAELPGILNWTLAGCRTWQTSGLTPPDAVREATTDYRQDQDRLADFIDSRCVREREATIGATELFKAYAAWADENKAAPMSQTAFGEAMFERGFSRKKVHGVKRYGGIRLARLSERGTVGGTVGTVGTPDQEVPQGVKNRVPMARIAGSGPNRPQPSPTDLAGDDEPGFFDDLLYPRGDA